MWNVSAETHLRLWNAKYDSRMPRNRSTIFNVKVIHYPCKCEPLSKIGRLSLINIELKLFQDCQRFLGQTAIPCCFFGLSLWTYRYFIFWWSLIRTPLGQESCLPTPSLSIWRFCGKRGKNLPSPSPLGRPDTQDSNARVTWLCASVRYWPGRGLVHVCKLLLHFLYA